MVNLPDVNSIIDFFTKNPFLWRLLATLLVAIGAYIVSKLIRSSIRTLTMDKVQRHFRRTAYRIFQTIIAVVAIFILLGIWGFSLTGLIAGAGFMGIVVGLAAQETLGNVISGFLMMFSRPFEIGDWVEIAGYSGIVEDITTMQTRLETYDGEVVSIPNSMVSSTEINNKSRKGQLRIKKTIGIDYESDPVKARRIAVEVMEEQGQIMEDPAPRAMIDELADSSVNIVLLFWIDDPTPRKRRMALNNVITIVKERFEEAGIGIPFPHREILQHEDREWKLGKE